MLHVFGKGRRERDVVSHDDVKALIEQHQADMARAGISGDRRAPVRTLLPPAQDTLVGMPGAASPGVLLAAFHLASTFSAHAPLVNGAGFAWAGMGIVRGSAVSACRKSAWLPPAGGLCPSGAMPARTMAHDGQHGDELTELADNSITRL